MTTENQFQNQNFANQGQTGNQFGPQSAQAAQPQGNQFIPQQQFGQQFPAQNQGFGNQQPGWPAQQMGGVGAQGFPVNPGQAPQTRGVQRPPDFLPVRVFEVRRYSDKNGRPRVSFNFGAIHISHKQLTSAGVHNPDILVGEEILVDFFKPGDRLLNGSIVTDPGRIVNRFAVHKNKAVEDQIEVQLKMEAHKNWLVKESAATGANQRPSGIGTGSMLDNGVSRIAPPGIQTDFSQSPAGLPFDQRNLGMPPAMTPIPQAYNQYSQQENLGNAQPGANVNMPPVQNWQNHPLANQPVNQPFPQQFVPNQNVQQNQGGGQGQVGG